MANPTFLDPFTNTLSNTGYGVTATGFVIKPFSVCLAEIQADFQAIFGNTINLDPSEPFGQWCAILADRESLLWQGLAAVYAARDPDMSEGVGLVELSAITGTVPVSPTFSTVTETLTGTTGTLVPSGQTISVQTALTQFRTTADATIAAATSWAGTTAYTTGQRRKNGGNVYQCIADGTSAGSGGPTTTAADITDGSVHWTFLGAGDGSIDVLCDSVDYGPQQALARTLTVISTPVSGWSAAINLLDAKPGIGFETDTDLRIRRINELFSHGSATVDAIRSGLVQLTDANGAAVLESANVFENVTDVTDGFGLPPHSIQAVAQYEGAPITATDLAIATEIFQDKSAGIQTFGTQVVTITDTQGQTHAIHFDYPTPMWLWVTIVGTKDPVTYGGDPAVKQAIVDFANGVFATEFAGYTMGDDVFAGRLYAPITDNVSGIVDISSLTTAVTAVGGGDPGPGDNTPKVMSRIQIAQFDTSRITVTFS